VRPWAGEAGDWAGGAGFAVERAVSGVLDPFWAASRSALRISHSLVRWLGEHVLRGWPNFDAVMGMPQTTQ
jgi:hypothetical protein